jgi:hypothetical protein
MGCVIGLIGLAVFVSKNSLAVDRAHATITLRWSLCSWKKQLVIPISDGIGIVMDYKEFLDIECSFYSAYVISLETSEGEQWPIHVSTFPRAELELAQAIAQTLNLPLRDYGKNPSPDGSIVSQSGTGDIA